MSSKDDRRVIEAQIGRPLRAPSEVVQRCHLGLPVVVEVPPHLDDGTPFPTLFWLTCPLAAARIGRLEGSGGVRRMETKARSEPGFGAALTEAHAAYAAERDALIVDETGPNPSGGVGGAAKGVKCLHAHYAHFAAGRDNPVGELVAGWVEPLDCEVPCVHDGGLNPKWTAKP
ncbi:MAG: DUF501 domain-containing protein [Acidimicrobiia bacterium]|jgi:hypothetical protein